MPTKKVLSTDELMKRADFSIKMLSPCGIFCGLCPQFTKEKKNATDVILEKDLLVWRRRCAVS